MHDELNTLHRYKILVVDDTAANLRLLTELLIEHGYKVYPSSDGELALEFVRTTLPDLILMDIRLPGIDGYEVCRRLKADGQTHDIPVIFISGLKDEPDKVKGFQSGAVDYITKPFQSEEVLARIRTHLRLKKLTVHLEQEVRKRTDELEATNQQLLQELAERRKAEALLCESEQKYRGLIQKIHAAVVVHGADTRIVTSNRQAQQLLGLTQGQMVGKAAIDPDWHFLREDGTAMPVEEYPVNRVLATGQPLRNAVAGVHRSTATEDVWVLVNADPVADKQGDIEQIIVTFVDITAHRKAQKDLFRMNRQLRAISTCNQFLMRASDEQTLLDEVCRIICQEAGYRMAWVGYKQNDDDRTVRPMAWAGVAEGYLADAEFSWADSALGQGPTGQAVRDGVIACIQDFASDPQAAPWRDRALRHGYRSSTALPLMDEDGTPFGALSIYSAEPDTFSPDEIQLLEELAGNLAFGITARRIRVRHNETQRQILASEQLFRALVENSPDFIARYDREFRRIYINPAIQQLFGGRPTEALDKTPADQSPLYAPQVYLDHLRQTIETAAESTAEIPFRTAQGEMHWGHMRFVPEFGPDDHVVSVLAIGRDIHEVKENENRFRMLAENFPDFVMRFDRDGRYTYVNPAVEEALGLPADVIVGKSLRKLLQDRRPEQNDALQALIRRAFDEGVANESEMVWQTVAGERIFDIRHAPEKDAAGHVVSVLSIARDITNRKQMEQERLAHLKHLENMDRINRAIQENNDLEQMMSDVLDAVLSVFDCDRTCLLYPCDPQARAWKVLMQRAKPGFTDAFALGLEVPMDPQMAEVFRVLLASDGPVNFGPETDFPLPEDVSERFGSKRLMAMALHPRVGKSWQFELHQRANDRIWTKEEERLFQETGRRLEDALTSLLMQRDLKDSEERHRLVFENSPVSIWEEDFSAVKAFFDGLKKQGVTDIDAYFRQHPEAVQHCAASVKIVDVNRAVLALHGAANKEELLDDLVNTFTPESFDTFRRELVCLWEGGTGMTADAVVKTLAGEQRYVTVYFSVCRGHEQTLSKVIVSIIDITERKQIEKKLSLYSDHLEALVQERTMELKASNQELESFAYSVSHDLRAPLRHILGFLELLQKEAGTVLDQQSRHYMDTITDAAQKMGLLIDDLLAFSRMGRQALAFQQVDLQPLLREVIQELESDDDGRSTDWRIGDLPAVEGDASMLRIVLVNLIANAWKFTRHRPQARIEIDSLPGRDRETVIYVRDNGVGFDMAYADKLFGVFQRLHRTDEFEGTGIGLATVRRIIDKHGGRVWAEAAVDQGATFYVALPLFVQGAQINDA